MMKKKTITQVSRRERQILEILYQQGESSVSDVREAIPDPPSYSTVRALLGILKDKGFVKHRKQGRSYLYTPIISRTKASGTMLDHVVRTFFGGSVEQVVATLMNMSSARLTDEEFDRLSRLIESKRRQEKK